MKRTVYLAALTCFLFLFAYAQQQQHTEIKIDPKSFDEFAGQYRFDDNPDLVFSFFREDGKFFMQPVRQLRTEIFPESESRFFLTAADAQATFVRDAQGKATGLIWRQNNQE